MADIMYYIPSSVRFFVILLISVLVVTACGKKKTTPESTYQNDQSNPEVSKSVAPSFEVLRKASLNGNLEEIKKIH
ncbi:MAG: hypothetical protein U5K69_23105 [Balneolaceae bacterium]|nr:hypothetical protein [Balneolaceae bacterium]